MEQTHGRVVCVKLPPTKEECIFRKPTLKEWEEFLRKSAKGEVPVARRELCALTLVSPDDGDAALERFFARYPASIEDLWNAITDLGWTAVTDEDVDPDGDSPRVSVTAGAFRIEFKLATMDQFEDYSQERRTRPEAATTLLRATVTAEGRADLERLLLEYPCVLSKVVEAVNARSECDLEFVAKKD